MSSLGRKAWGGLFIYVWYGVPSPHVAVVMAARAFPSAVPCRWCASPPQDERVGGSHLFILGIPLNRMVWGGLFVLCKLQLFRAFGVYLVGKVLLSGLECVSLCVKMWRIKI